MFPLEARSGRVPFALRTATAPTSFSRFSTPCSTSLGSFPIRPSSVIANALNLSRADVYGVLSFYHEFRRAPAGRHVVKMCRAEACQAMHSDEVCAHAEERLGTIFGETSDDGEYTLEAVYCLGNCARSPAMMIDGDLFGCVDKKRFDAIIGDLDKEAAA